MVNNKAKMASFALLFLGFLLTGTAQNSDGLNVQVSQDEVRYGDSLEITVKNSDNQLVSPQSLSITTYSPDGNIHDNRTEVLENPIQIDSVTDEEFPMMGVYSVRVQADTSSGAVSDSTSFQVYGVPQKEVDLVLDKESVYYGEELGFEIKNPEGEYIDPDNLNATIRDPDGQILDSGSIILNNPTDGEITQEDFQKTGEYTIKVSKTSGQKTYSDQETFKVKELHELDPEPYIQTVSHTATAEEGEEARFRINIRNNKETRLEGEIAVSYETELTTLSNYYDVEAAPESTRTINFRQEFVKDARGRTSVEAGKNLELTFKLYNQKGTEIDTHQSNIQIVDSSDPADPEKDTQAPPVPGEETKEETTKAPPVPGQSSENKQQNSTEQASNQTEKTGSQESTTDNSGSSIVAKILSVLPFL